MINSNNIIKEEKNVLYFADLPLNASQEDIKTFLGESFIPYIASINIKKPGSAVVIFREHSVAKEVKHKFNLTRLNDNLIRIMWHENDFKKVAYGSDSKNIFVKNIPDEVSPREIYEYFYQFGEIASAKMNLDKLGNHIGYGYINYESPISAETAIAKCNGKAVFTKYPHSIVEVAYFKKGVQRGEHTAYLDYLTSNSSKNYETKCSVYVKNISPNLKDLEYIKNLFCNNIGEITYFMPNFDKNNNNNILSIIISYKDEFSANKAALELDNKEINGSKISVEKLKGKESEKSNFNQIYNVKGTPIGNSFNSNNLGVKIFVKNVPTNLTQDEIVAYFSKFGKVINCNMYTSNSTYKDITTGSYKDIKSFTGTVQITLDSLEAAQKAITTYNGKYLEKYGTWKYPLIISMFKSKNERNVDEYYYNNPNINKEAPFGDFNSGISNVNNTPYMIDFNNYNNNNFYGNNKNNYRDNRNMDYGNNNYNNSYNNNNKYNNNKGYNNNKYHNNYNNNYSNNNNYKQMENQFNNMNIKDTNTKNKNNTKIETKVNNSNPHVLDNNYFQTLIDDSQKKEYIGELIFHNISEHPLVESEGISYDDIGKITGMILGIEDINEIILVCNSYSELTLRINEALKLLRS